MARIEAALSHFPPTFLTSWWPGMVGMNVAQRQTTRTVIANTVESGWNSVRMPVYTDQGAFGYATKKGRAELTQPGVTEQH